MKKLAILIVIAVFQMTVCAQVPQKLSYQSVVRNTSGGLITSQAVGMKISILKGSATGTVVFWKPTAPIRRPMPTDW